MAKKKKKNRPGSRKGGRKPKNPDGSYRPAGPGERRYTSARCKEIAVRVDKYRGPWPPAGPPELYLKPQGQGGWGIPGTDGWSGADGWTKPACKRWRAEQEEFDRTGVRYRNRTPNPRNGYKYLGWDPEKAETHPPDDDVENRRPGEGEGGDEEDDDDEEEQGEDDEEEEQGEEEEEGDDNEEEGEEQEDDAEEEEGEEDDEAEGEDDENDQEEDSAERREREKLWDAPEDSEHFDEVQEEGRQGLHRGPSIHGPPVKAYGHLKKGRGKAQQAPPVKPKGPRLPAVSPSAKAKAFGNKTSGAKGRGKEKRKPIVWVKRKASPPKAQRREPPPPPPAAAERPPAVAAPPAKKQKARRPPEAEERSPPPRREREPSPPPRRTEYASQSSSSSDQVNQIFDDTVRASAHSLADVHRKTFGSGSLTRSEVLEIVDVFREALEKEAARR